MSHVFPERFHPDARYDQVDFDPLTEEIWYPIPSMPGYQLSSDLRLRTCKASRYKQKGEAWQIMTPQVFKRPKYNVSYIAYDVRVDRKKRRIFLQWIVAELAYGPRPDGLQVLHRDDNSFNNHSSNLAYGTHEMNVMDALRNGRYRRGERHGVAKLTPDQVREIREMFDRYVPRTRIMARYSISRSHLNRLCSGEAWGHQD